MINDISGDDNSYFTKHVSAFGTLIYEMSSGVIIGEVVILGAKYDLIIRLMQENLQNTQERSSKKIPKKERKN